MFHKVYKLCKNDLPIIIFFGILLLFVVAAFILGFIAEEKRENMSPEEKAAEAAQMHHEDVEEICNYLGDGTKKDGVRTGVDWDTEECVLVTQVNLKTSGEDTPLIGEYRVNAKDLQDGNKHFFGGAPVIKDVEEKEGEEKIQKLCYEGKPVHIVDGHAEGVYQKFPQDKDDSEYSDQQKQIRNARLLDTSCEPGSVQMRVWDGSDPGRAPYPIRVIPYYNK